MAKQKGEQCYLSPMYRMLSTLDADDDIYTHLALEIAENQAAKIFTAYWHLT